MSLFAVFMVESIAFMSPSVKTFLFYSLIFLFLSVFIFFILIPGAKLLKIIPFLSDQEAANIISNYFTDSKDVLINVLQLHKNENSDLIVAAINQKIDLISPLNFSNAIDYKKTSRFLLVSIGIILLLVLFGSIYRNKIKDGSTRFLDYSTYYQPANPYSISVLNDSLVCACGEDFVFRIKLSGPSVLNDVFIQNESLNLRMNQDSADVFSYSFKNVTDLLSFRLNYLGFSSETYSISVVHKPSIFVSRVTVVPPTYTNIEASEFDNVSDFSVPFGSKISWNFDLDYVDKFEFYADSTLIESVVSQETSVVSKNALKSFDYSFSAVGDGGLKTESNMFHVNVLPDYAPQIVAVSSVDSSSANGIFFSGHITDDYGFHSLTFNYFDSGNPASLKSQNIDLHPNVSQDFYYYFDFGGLSKSVSYYFEVRDNDAISGFKSTRTPLSLYTTITDEEKQERVNSLNSSIFDKIEESQRLLRSLNNDLNDFQKSVSSNNQMSDYEKQLKLDNLMEKQERLRSLMDDLNQDNQFKNAFENQLQPEMSKELLEKQEMLQKMWEELLTDDIKELLDKINEIAKSQTEKNLRENIQDLKFDFNQISEQLDRNSDLMKMYNIDNSIQNLSKDLKNMSKEYQELSKELKEMSSKSQQNKDGKNNKTDRNSSNKSDSGDNADQNSDDSDKSMSEKLSEFNKKFNQKQADYEKVQKQNDELGESKLDINDVSKQFDELKKELEKQYQEMNKLDKELGNKVPDQSSVDKRDDKSDNDNQNSAQSNEQDKAKSRDSKESDNAKIKDSKESNNANNNDSKESDNAKNTDSKESDNAKSSDSKEAKSDNKSSESDNSAQQNDSNNQDKSGDRMGEELQTRPSDKTVRQRKDDISQQMQESSEQMEELSEKLSGASKKNKQKKSQENLNDIRQILDNLVTISFNQESLLTQIKSNSSTVFLSTDALMKQNSIVKDFGLVQDSIYALAKREPRLGHSVYDKIDDIHTYFNKTISSINESSRSSAMNYQQVLLTNFNDLSLLFNEIQNQMQNQDQQSSENSGDEQQENQTRNKKEMQQRQKSTQQMKSQQQMLKQNLQKMLEQLQKGGSPSSQQLAESLRQQEMMLQQLQEMKNGKGVSSQEQKFMNQINQMMEENKRDIVNKNITQRTIDRQNTLFNKLLELEKAEKSQEFEEKRESKQGSDIQQDNQQKLNLKLKDFGVKEYLHTSPINLNLFYQNLYNDYIQNID
ncbi:MAG: hypothetical protein MJZ61_00515 [Bacteroidales bacterium]|nr:hypothetical protein [Bacteroidales bacterium]